MHFSSVGTQVTIPEIFTSLKRHFGIILEDDRRKPSVKAQFFYINKDIAHHEKLAFIKVILNGKPAAIGR